MSEIPVLELLDKIKTIPFNEHNLKLLLLELRDIFYSQKNKELYKLITCELNGYNNLDTLPEYRTLIDLQFDVKELIPGIADATKIKKIKCNIESSLLELDIKYEIKSELPNNSNIVITKNKNNLKQERNHIYTLFVDKMFLELMRIEENNFK